MSHLTIDFEDYTPSTIKFQWNGILPLAKSSEFEASVLDFKKLTNGDDVKRTYEIALDVTEQVDDLRAGDTIGIFCRNNINEVQNVLNSLSVRELADKTYNLKVAEGKKNSAFPKHIPARGTLRDTFLHYVNLRSVPKKLFLRALINYTTNLDEKTLLETLSSPKGVKEYNDFISNKGRTLLGILESFQSCTPPVSLILQYLPPLLPRPYSLSNHPKNNDLIITFNILETANGLKGVCSGYLEEIGHQFESEKEATLRFYFRNPTNFRLPTNSTCPAILIATGTGIAPFRGFLQQREEELKHNALGRIWLFYGCRYSSRDNLYENEFEEYCKNGVIQKMFNAFSRDTDKKVYVQDLIKKNGVQLVDLILKKESLLFICGSLQVINDVKASFSEIFVEHVGFTQEEADSNLKQLQASNKLITDVWL